MIGICPRNDRIRGVARDSNQQSCSVILSVLYNPNICIDYGMKVFSIKGVM